MEQCASTHNLYAMECLREVRALWRALLFPFEARADGPQGVGSVWAPALKACALIVLHMMIEENSGRSENGSSVSSSSSDENNVGNDALFVIELHGSGDKIALFLQDWELANATFELLCSPGHVVPENCMKSKGDVTGSDFECASQLSDKPL